MHKYILTFAATLLACLIFLSDAAAAELGKGVNLSNWFANAMRQPVYEKDFQQIASAGFRHVRLPVNPEEYGFPLRSNSRPTDFKFDQIDRAIALAEKYKLQIILDIHPASNFMETLEKQSWAEQSFADFWAYIAAHYKNKYMGTLVFELLNEPQYYNNEKRYNNLMKNVVAAIRKVDTTRTLIIGAPQGSSLEGLQELDTLRDSNIMYAFHFYEPYMITHQGIHMGFEDRMLRYFRNVPYPSGRATKDARSYASNAPDPLQARNELQDYKDENWDAGHIASRIRTASEWARNHGNVRLICTEYGVLRNHIDADSRYRWIQDARVAMESNNIAWSLWDYADLFGIVTLYGATSTDRVDGSVRLLDAEKSSRTIEPAAMQALGLSGRAAGQSQSTVTTTSPAATTRSSSEMTTIPAENSLTSHMTIPDDTLTNKDSGVAVEINDENMDYNSRSNTDTDTNHDNDGTGEKHRDYRHHHQYWHKGRRDFGKPVVYP
ncbi:MAG: cellulase family glycosylhydrolase [Rickettsiales bacterium]